jgi:hypothetical protein
MASGVGVCVGVGVPLVLVANEMPYADPVAILLSTITNTGNHKDHFIALPQYGTYGIRLRQEPAQKIESGCLSGDNDVVSDEPYTAYAATKRTRNAVTALCPMHKRR